MAPTRTALLVATDRYDDTGLRRLTAPAADAEALRRVLSDPEIAGFDVRLLVNEPHHVVGRAVADLYRGRGRNDLTLLYFTGHGVKDDSGRLYLALPPLYRLSHGGKAVYARDDAHRDALLASEFKGKKPEISRFKGLGEMMPQQLKETTMDPAKRTLARVTLPRAEETVAELVEALMGRKPELRFRFIQENAEFAAADIDV